MMQERMYFLLFIVFFLLPVCSFADGAAESVIHGGYNVTRKIQDSEAAPVVVDAVAKSYGVQGGGEIYTALKPTIQSAMSKMENAEIKAINNTESKIKNKTSDMSLADLDKKRDVVHNIVSGASTAMTGIGMMQAVQGFSEQKSDAAAESDMAAHIATFKCNYDKGPTFKYSTKEIIIPGGDELLKYYTEYKTLADQLKETKAALNLTPGIESQVVYDKAESGLYQNFATERAAGHYASVSRALMDSDSEDAAAWAAEKEKSQKRLAIGASVAVGGILTGVIGDKLIDKHYDKLEDELDIQEDGNDESDEQESESTVSDEDKQWAQEQLNEPDNPFKTDDSENGNKQIDTTKMEFEIEEEEVVPLAPVPNPVSRMETKPVTQIKTESVTDDDALAKQMHKTFKENEKENKDLKKKLNSDRSAKEKQDKQNAKMCSDTGGTWNSENGVCKCGENSTPNSKKTMCGCVMGYELDRKAKKCVKGALLANAEKRAETQRQVYQDRQNLGQTTSVINSLPGGRK